MADTLVTALIKQSAIEMKSQFSAQLYTVSTSEIEQTLQTILDSLLPKDINLSTTRPDYESVIFQMMKAVEASGVWNDASIAATGQMLLRLVASDVAYTQFSIARAVQEGHAHTATNASSIYAHARSNGVRLSRKIPQQVVVNLTRADTLGTSITLPRWTQFVINGVNYFNREALVFGSETLYKNLTLAQGTIKTASLTSSGVAYQDLEIGQEDWSISDTDIRCTINTLEWTRTTKPLFLFNSGDRVFYENTLPNGNVELKFGNGIYGSRPAVGVTMTVSWIETLGEAAPPPPSLTPVISNNSAFQLSGEVLDVQSVGQNELPLSYYKQFAGDLHAMVLNEAAHRRDDHRALALKFPGVYDVRFLGQAETNPDKPSWANVVRVLLLTDPVFSTTQWEEFQSYFLSGVPFKPTLVRQDAVPREFNVTADVYCFQGANLDDVQSQLEKDLRQAFAPRAGSLNRSIYRDEISAILKGRGRLNGLIDYTRMTEPPADVLVDSPEQWPRISLITLAVRYSTRTGAGRIV